LSYHRVAKMGRKI